MMETLCTKYLAKAYQVAGSREIKKNKESDEPYLFVLHDSSPQPYRER